MDWPNMWELTSRRMKTLDTIMRTTKTAKELTVTLSQK